MKPAKLLLSAAVLFTVAGCQTIKPSDQTLKERAEFALNTPVSKVTNVRSDSTITYYTATTAKGEYNCQMPSGAIVAVGSMGLYEPTPSCLKEGQAIILQ
ncbi:hypothetical protein KMS_R26590 [Pseudomonas sp. LRP2-20]|uniref:hypothetical protein n=1 Tax=Pseudomonas sp. LRP2-20 TaxID=2944234 RepID=UPI002184AA1B|nr:hypothetical protein [Pseudomonas sp. LRP2-20]BDM22902.1 hypothetical protein KMS_R26590 [Pseudomonas sp. LRP2-20]